MSNVFKLDGSTNVKMGTFCGRPALFVRPMFPKDPVNHSQEERHADHMNDLVEDEQVFVLGTGQDLGQLYMAMRQVSANVKRLHRGEEMSVHIHTHPSSGEQAVDRKFANGIVTSGWNGCTEPGIQAAVKISDAEERVKEIFSFDNKHQHSTSVERNVFIVPDPTLSYDNH